MSDEFVIIYNLKDPGALAKAQRDRRYWGMLYTDVEVLDDERVVLTFRPAPNPRWRRWEEVRRRWILGQVPEGVAGNGG